MKKQIISVQKEMLITSGIIFVCMVLFIVFPVNNVFQRIISSFTFLFLIPLLYVKIILGKKISDFGWQTENWRRAIKWILIASLIFILTHLILYKFTVFPEKYLLIQSNIRDYFQIFLIYEMLVVYFLLLYAFFFQGFVMFYFSHQIGRIAIILQTILFYIFMDVANSFKWDNIQFIILAPLAGLIAYKTKSIFYSVGFSLLAVIISDAFYIKLVN